MLGCEEINFVDRVIESWLEGNSTGIAFFFSFSFLFFIFFLIKSTFTDSIILRRVIKARFVARCGRIDEVSLQNWKLSWTEWIIDPLTKKMITWQAISGSHSPWFACLEGKALLWCNPPPIWLVHRTWYRYSIEPSFPCIEACCPLVESNGVLAKNGLQAQIVLKKGEGIMIPCAQNDVVHFCCGTVIEMDGAAVDHDQWSFCYLRDPQETHGLCFPSANDAFGAILETLENDVFRRYTRAYHKNVLILKMRGIPEGVRV